MVFAKEEILSHRYKDYWMKLFRKRKKNWEELIGNDYSVNWIESFYGLFRGYMDSSYQSNVSDVLEVNGITSDVIIPLYRVSIPTQTVTEKSYVFITPPMNDTTQMVQYEWLQCNNDLVTAIVNCILKLEQFEWVSCNEFVTPDHEVIVSNPFKLLNFLGMIHF